MIEKAIFVSAPERLPRARAEHARLYFGNEFCERLLPDDGQLAEALAWARARGMAFTLVTPCVTGRGLDALEPLLERLAGEAEGPSEVVVNDWGVLRAVTEGRWRGAFAPVLGRLLTKQKRDPRIPALRTLPEAAREVLRSCGADAAALGDFWRERGVARLELDNLPQGLRRHGELKASLYVPFSYVSTTRLCYMAGADSGPRYLRRMVPCARECRLYTARLSRRGMGGDILLKGNTQFVVNAEPPRDLEALGIDRLVHQPAPPM